MGAFKKNKTSGKNAKYAPRPDKPKPEEVRAVIARVSGVTVAVNTALAVFKLFAGVIADSGAMISDAVHTFSDIVTTVIAYIGVRLSRRKPDDDHPYGHDRFESVASILLAGLLFATGAAIGFAGLKKIFGAGTEAIVVPGVPALLAAGVSIAVKEWMYWYTRKRALYINSTAFMADAWHHRSDALSSVGSLIGIAGARLGLPVLDPAASVVISFLILKVSVDIFRDAIRKLTDRACDPETASGIKETILAHEHVLGIDVFNTRVFGSRIYVDAEITVDGSQTLEEAHKIAQQIHDEIEQKFPGVKHVMIHQNPGEGAKPGKD